MNSQFVAISRALRSNQAFVLIASAVAASLFLKPGFISVSVIWFFAVCINSSFVAPGGKSVKRNFLLALPLAIFASELLGILYASNTEQALNVLLRKIHLLLIPLGFIIARKHLGDRELHLVLGVFFAACLITSVYCLSVGIVKSVQSGTLSVSSNGAPGYFLLSHTLVSPLNVPAVYVSMYYNFAVLIVLFTPIFDKLRIKVLLASYFGCLILMCQSMIGILALLIIAGYWLWSAGYIKALTLGVTLLAIPILFFSFLRPQDMRVKLGNVFKIEYSPDEDFDSVYTSDRLRIWPSAWAAIKEQPLIGHGTSEGQAALQQEYLKNRQLREMQDSLNAHNQFLTTALDLGVFGFLVLAGAILIPLIIALYNKWSLQAGFLLIVGLFFLAESVLARQKGIVFFSFFYSFLFNFPTRKPPVSKPVNGD